MVRRLAVVTFVVSLVSASSAAAQSPIAVETLELEPTVVKTGDVILQTYRLRFPDLISEGREILILEDRMVPENLPVHPFEAVSLDVVKRQIEDEHIWDFEYGLRIIAPEKAVYLVPSFAFYYLIRDLGEDIEDAEIQQVDGGQGLVRYVSTMTDVPVLDIRDTIELGGMADPHRQGDHAAVRGAQHAVGAFDAEVAQRDRDGVRLVSGREMNPVRRLERPGRSEEVDREQPPAVRVDRQTRARQLPPPAGRGIQDVGADVAVGGDPPHRDEQRGVFAPGEFVAHPEAGVDVGHQFRAPLRRHRDGAPPTLRQYGVQAASPFRLASVVRDANSGAADRPVGGVRRSSLGPVFGGPQELAPLGVAPRLPRL